MAKSFFESYVTGDAALDRKLEQLKEKTRKKFTRAALSKGGTLLVRSIKAEAPVGKTKKLKKSIGKSLKKVKSFKTGEDFQGLRAGANVGKKAERSAPHTHLNVLGTQERFTKSGKSTGKMTANDFVKRGATKALPAVDAAIKAELLKRIDSEANK